MKRGNGMNEKLRIEAENIVAKTTERMKDLLPDADGNRPVASWALITRHGSKDSYDEWVELYDTVEQAVSAYEDIQGDKYYTGAWVAYIVVNEGGKDCYEDCNGIVYADYDYLEL